MVVLLVTRLRDVEHQLWQAATAVKLHLKLLNASPRYHNDVVVAADQVQALVTSIEQVQNELQVSTTEMLSLAKKFDTKEDNHNDDIADSEETETEDDDEGVELEDYSQQKEEEKELPEAVQHVEQSAEEEKEKLTVDGTVEFLKTLPVGQETVDLTQDVDEDQETVEEEQEVTTMEEKKLVTQSSKRLNDEEIEVSQNNDDEENASIETEPVVDESKEEEEEREMSVEKEKKVTKETSKMSSSELRSRIATIRRSAISMTTDYHRRLQVGDFSVEDATTFSKGITTMVSIVTHHRSKYCRRLWIEQIVGMLTWMLDGVKKPELSQALVPVRESCIRLQQYCNSQFPDYLQDMLYDVMTVKTLEQKNTWDSSNLGSFLQLFVDQLRFDCLEYSSKRTTNGVDLRTEEQWGHVSRICEQLIALINQTDGQQITAKNVPETISALREFDVLFPTRIPAKLLECLNGIDAINTLSKKRPHSDSDMDGPKLKRVAHQDLFGEVNLIVTRYVEATKLAISDVASSMNDEITAKMIARLKKTAIAANDAMYEHLKTCDNSVVEIGAHFSSATAFTAKTMCDVPVREVDYSWLRKMIDGLFAILNMVSHSTILMQEHDSLVSSAHMLEKHCNCQYVREDCNAPSLELLEERVQRFQKDPRRLTNPKTVTGPIQSLSSGFVKYFKTWTVKCLVRTEENWARFKALGEVLAEWIQCSSQVPTKSKAKLMRNFLDQLKNFADKYPGRLPSSLLTITTALAAPKVRSGAQETHKKLAKNRKKREQRNEVIQEKQGTQEKQGKKGKKGKQGNQEKRKVQGIQICYANGRVAIIPADPEQS